MGSSRSRRQSEKRQSSRSQAPRHIPKKTGPPGLPGCPVSASLRSCLGFPWCSVRSFFRGLSGLCPHLCLPQSCRACAVSHSVNSQTRHMAHSSPSSGLRGLESTCPALRAPPSSPSTLHQGPQAQSRPPQAPRSQTLTWTRVPGPWKLPRRPPALASSFTGTGKSQSHLVELWGLHPWQCEQSPARPRELVQGDSLSSPRRGQGRDIPAPQVARSSHPVTSQQRLLVKTREEMETWAHSSPRPSHHPSPETTGAWLRVPHVSCTVRLAHQLRCPQTRDTRQVPAPSCPRVALVLCVSVCRGGLTGGAPSGWAAAHETSVEGSTLWGLCACGTRGDFLHPPKATFTLGLWYPGGTHTLRAESDDTSLGGGRCTAGSVCCQQAARVSPGARWFPQAPSPEPRTLLPSGSPAPVPGSPVKGFGAVLNGPGPLGGCEQPTHTGGTRLTKSHGLHTQSTAPGCR